MKRFWLAAIMLTISVAAAAPTWAQNPFTDKPGIQQKTPAPPIKNKFFVKIVLWQHQWSCSFACPWM
jgi:hypothetical protein